MMLCIDANIFYGWVIIQDLPYCGFKFLPQKEINEFSLNVSENSPIGYILEVDLEVIIHYVLKKLKLVLIRCQSIIVRFLISME